MSSIVHVNEADFQSEVINSEIPVLVDFTAVWCGPCKMLEPVVEELVTELAGRMKVVKLDVDNNPNLAMQYNVMGVPTLMLFVDGQEAQRLVGFLPKKRILSKISTYIS